MKKMMLFLWWVLGAGILLSGCQRGVSIESSLGPLTPNVVVAQDGTGDFTTLQAAINEAPQDTSTLFVIYIKRGVYDTEKLIVPQGKNHVVLIGEDREETVISYHMYDCTNLPSLNKCPQESWELWKDNADLVRTSATLTIKADDFHMENLTLRNTAGPVGQALALTVTGDRSVYVNCNIESYQDTIYLWTAGQRSYFKNCLVVGRTDYIYGGGMSFFEGCEIRSWGGGWVTAPSTAEQQPYGFVFYQCNFTYATNSPRPTDDGRPIAIGRPWHNYPKVAIIYSELCAEMDTLGWPTLWHMPYAETDDRLHLYEYGNTGPGADMSKRSAWAGLRSLRDDEVALYTKEKVLSGTDGWNPIP